MSIGFFRPNEISEIRLKFSNINKTGNQTSLKLAPKQANAIETYEHKGFNKPTTTKDTSLLLSKLFSELKIIGASAYSIRHSATTELAKLEQMAQRSNQQIIQAKIMKDQTKYLNKDMRLGENVVTNYYPRLAYRQGNNLLSPYLLISPLTHPQYTFQLEMTQKQGENSLEN
ncbi:MAG: hypothetical protein EZS28_021947 [Streblomastix strix]|uniref:Uncharacterized protein n=1 Tax=Streblomastix strix TaxID=222440 RepID=A0A5J4VJ67_9EUKA|nr:MAG: hypothetical protein EZS28_021947 [Streblomastix strix]